MPDAPNGLVATLGTGATQADIVFLAWKAPRSNGDGATRYSIAVQKEGVQEQTHTAHTLNLTITGLTPASQYSASVTAHNGIGEV